LKLTLPKTLSLALPNSIPSSINLAKLDGSKNGQIMAK
jgi:hypothetical protein